MFELGTLLLAVLAATKWHESDVETYKELYSRLGLHPYLYIGMPFVGGNKVLEFPDGSAFVELVTQQDFAVAGTSMNDGYIGGDLHGREEERRGDSPLFHAHQENKARIFVYVNERSVPVMRVWFLKDRLAYYNRDEKEAWTVGYAFSPNVLWLDSDRRGKSLPFVPDEIRDRLLVFWLGIEPSLREDGVTLASASHGETHPLVALKELRRDLSDPGKNGLEDEQLFNMSTLHAASGDDDVSEWLDSTIEELFNKSSSLMYNLGRKLDIQIMELPRDANPHRIWVDYKIGIPDTPYAIPSYQPRIRFVIRQPSAAWLRNNRIPDEMHPGRLKLKTPLVYWQFFSPVGDKSLGWTSYANSPIGLLNKFMGLQDYIDRWVKDLEDEVLYVPQDVPHRWIVDPATLLPT